MAAHEPVAELDYGIVAKIDLSEIRAPFLKAGVIAGFFTVLVVLAGASLFIKITNPVIRQLETRTMKLQTMTDEMGKEIEERKRIEEALSWEADINNALSELSRKLISSSTIEDISSQVLETSRKFTTSALGYTGYIELETGYLICPTLTRDIWESCQVKEKNIIFKTYHGLWGWVLRKQKPILTNAPSTDPRSGGIPEGHMPIHRFLSAPAIYGNDVVGQISLANPDRDFKLRDLKLVERIADIYAIAIHRKRAEDALQQAHQNLEKRVEERTADLKKSNVHLKQEIAERKKMEKALRKSEEQLRALAARIQEVQETERKRLAQELHDRVGQNLSALNLNLSVINGQLSNESNIRIGGRLQDSMSLVEETTVHIRDVMAELHPPVLDDYGLLAALRWYCEPFSDRTKIEVKIYGEELSSRLPLVIESVFFRIAQEALTNAAKHSGASLVTVTLENFKTHQLMTIEDNGRGFDVTALNQSKKHTGWGLTTMKERAVTLGGLVRIESKQGKGTKIITEFRR